MAERPSEAQTQAEEEPTVSAPGKRTGRHAASKGIEENQTRCGRKPTSRAANQKDTVERWQFPFPGS